MTEAALFEVGDLSRRLAPTVRIFSTFFPRWGRGRGEAWRSARSFPRRKVKTIGAGLAAPRWNQMKTAPVLNFLLFRSYDFFRLRKTYPATHSSLEGRCSHMTLRQRLVMPPLALPLNFPQAARFVALLA